MIIARTEKEVDDVIDYFIEEGFISCTRTYKPDLEEWRDYIKTEYLTKKGLVIFIPHWDYDPAVNDVIKTLNWHVPDTLEEYLNTL